MHVFVTVGSTKFDSLVQTALSPKTLAALHRKGYKNLVVQCGNSIIEEQQSTLQDNLTFAREGLDIEIWRFKPSLEQHLRKADLIISHAGSGTILEVLRLGKPIIVVPNPTLLDNHQEELAQALEGLGHLKAATVENLATVVETFDVSTITPFPEFDPSKFPSLMDKEMGFVF